MRKIMGTLRRIQKGRIITSGILAALVTAYGITAGCSGRYISQTRSSEIVKLNPKDPVHIAYWLVKSGSYSELGLDTLRGIEIAIEDFGNRIKGHKIKLSGFDSRCSSEGGESAAKKIASDPTVLAAIGPNCSRAAEPGAAILWEKHIPTISPTNTSPVLADPHQDDGYSGYLRTIHNDKIQGIIAAEFAYYKLGLRTAATIHDGSVYADELLMAFSDTFIELGGNVTSRSEITPGDTDMRPILTKIASQPPGILFFPVLLEEAAYITRQVVEFKDLGKTRLMSSDTVYAFRFLKAAGPFSEGMYFTCPDFSAYPLSYAGFLKKYKKKYGINPTAPFHAHAYDAATILLAAIDRVAEKSWNGNLSINRIRLNAALHATKNHEGLTGNLSCDPYGNCADPHIAVFRITGADIDRGSLPLMPYWTPY